jgi:hypothetical protein
LRYANEEAPMAGDRIKNSAGGLGTVTAISKRSSAHSEPARITVRWDEGIIEIDYDLAAKFTLVSRASAAAKMHGTAGRS